MEISLLQAFALGIIAFIAGLDMFNGLTHMHRPVVLGPLVGLVLGDLHTGILTGGTLELVWMGLAPLAGAQPPNVIIGTIVGTAFAITTGVKPDVAVGVAVPFAVAVQMGITFLFSVMSGVMSRCDRMAENADNASYATYGTPHPAIGEHSDVITQFFNLPLSFLSMITDFVLFPFSPLNFRFLFYRF